jgi:threonine synthase
LIDIPLACHGCGRPASGGVSFSGCEACGGTLVIQRSVSDIAEAWRHVAEPNSVVHIAIGSSCGVAALSLGEGRTPLLPATRAAAAAGVDRLWIKHEGCQPTGSYKDRLNAVAVAVAAGAGYDRVATSSTGNQGVSLAAYAAAAGVSADVFLPQEAPRHAEHEVQRLGGRVHRRQWGARAPELRSLVAAGVAYVGRNRPSPLANPYGLDGYKSIAYEIVSQLDGIAPDTVVMPSCGGDGIFGVWRGFQELASAGIIGTRPAMVAAHMAAAPAVFESFHRGDASVTPVPIRPSRALSLLDEQGGEHALWAMRESGGTSILVDDEELPDALDCYGQHGIVAEPAAGAALAAVMRLHETGHGGRVVVVMTGNGARWPQTFSGDNHETENEVIAS